MTAERIAEGGEVACTDARRSSSPATATLDEWSGRPPKQLDVPQVMHASAPVPAH